MLLWLRQTKHKMQIGPRKQRVCSPASSSSKRLAVAGTQAANAAPGDWQTSLRGAHSRFLPLESGHCHKGHLGPYLLGLSPADVLWAHVL